jgi:peptidoglycan/LPS O-acetylase OafA/YrhL
MSPPVAPERSRHLPYLDALRGLAIVGVIINHFIPVPGALYCGWMGVELFFVLSGFLITRILIAERTEAERAGTRGSALISFYCRRALRIFPIYYLCVLGLLLLKTSGMKERIWYHLTYTSNFRLVLHPLEPNYVRHFWSLCVEEQFYLVWPFLMLFLPRRVLLPVMVGTVLVGPLSRLGFAMGHCDRLALYMLPWCSLDCLGMGGLLAFVESRVGTENLVRSGLVRGCKWVGFVLMIGFLYMSARTEPYVFLRWFGPMNAIWIVGNTCLAVFFAYLVALSCQPGEGDWKRLLSMNWLRFTGKISYGLYVYHLIVGGQFQMRVPLTAYPVTLPTVWIMIPLSYLVAIISWYALERPILGFKDYFTQARVRSWFGQGTPARPAEVEHRSAA